MQRQPTIARARSRAAVTEARTARAVGDFPVPSTSQSIDTPNARASADAVSVVARCRSVSRSATCDGESPASALASRAEMPASSRSARSLDAIDMVAKPLAATSALVKPETLDAIDATVHGLDVTELGKRVQGLIDELGVSRRELAKRAGLTPSHIWQLTSGKVVKPNMVTLAAIAYAAGVIRSAYPRASCVSTGGRRSSCAARSSPTARPTHSGNAIVTACRDDFSSGA